MKVLVTGGTGFVGRHVVAMLRDARHEVDAASITAGLPEPVGFSLSDIRWCVR